MPGPIHRQRMEEIVSQGAWDTSSYQILSKDKILESLDVSEPSLMSCSPKTTPIPSQPTTVASCLLRSCDSTALLFSVDHLHWHCFSLPSSLWTSEPILTALRTPAILKTSRRYLNFTDQRWSGSATYASPAGLFMLVLTYIAVVVALTRVLTSTKSTLPTWPSILSTRLRCWSAFGRD